MHTTNNTEYPVSALRICIDDTGSDGALTLGGQIAGVALDQTHAFASSLELMLLIERLLDTIGNPLAARRLRSFGAERERCTYCVRPKRYHPAAKVRCQTGALLTVDVVFVSRLYSSWQGIVRDEAGEMIGMFESDMELLGLLTSRLQLPSAAEVPV